MSEITSHIPPSPSFPHIQVLKKVLPGHILSDVVVAIASLDPILGDVDR